MEGNSLQIINWRKWREGGRGRIKEFQNISDSENVSPNQQTEYSLGEICLISDQGCGSAVRVVLREFLAQSEMREDHNYYGSLFFWECQPSFADPRGLNNLKSGLAVQLFLSPLSVPSETWGCSFLFSKPVSCLTSETPELQVEKFIYLGYLFKSPASWLGLLNMGQGCVVWECCLGCDLAGYRCAKCTSGHSVKNLDENHQATGCSSSLEVPVKGHPVAFPTGEQCWIPSWKRLFWMPCPPEGTAGGCADWVLVTRADSVGYRQWHGGTGINNSVFQITPWIYCLLGKEVISRPSANPQFLVNENILVLGLRMLYERRVGGQKWRRESDFDLRQKFRQRITRVVWTDSA